MNMRALKILMLFVIIAVGRVASQHEICSSSIADATSFTSAKPTDFQYGGLFIDVNNKVPCDSLVVGWYICYFLPYNSQAGEIYQVQLSLFKRDAPVNGILYIQRPETVVTAYVRSTASIDKSACGTVFLSMEYQFTVYQDEFIAVYAGENPTTGLREGNVLDIIGNTTNETETVSWRCPRSDDTVITGLDAFTSCLQTLPSHQIRAKLLVSTQTAIRPNTGDVDDMDPDIIPSPLPQPTVRIDTRTQSSTAQLAFKPTATHMQLLTGSQTMHSILQPTSTPFKPITGLGTIGQQSGILVPLSVTGACVIVVLLAGIVSILIVICVHQRRKAKLQLMKWRQERRNIMTDHFVLESELPAAMGEAMISNTPQPYEEPLTIHIVGQFENQAYESGLINIPRVSTNSYILNQEEGIYCEANAPAERASGEQDEGIYCEAVLTADQEEGIYSEANTPVDSSDIYDSIEENDGVLNCKTPPPHIQALYAVVDKKNRRKSSIAQPRESVLYQHYYKTLDEIASNTETSKDHFKNPASSEKDLLAQFEAASFTKIPSKEIKVLAHLGSGQFGQVSKGVWKSGKNSGDVAVKSFTAGASADKAMSRVRLLQEAIIMGQFTNPNVIHFYGMVIAKDTMMLVMELAAKGDLEHLLVSMVPDPGEMMSPTTNKLMLGFSQQVAFGMQYLSSKGFVHRDLAARNVLVTKDNVLKIADFGMSRDLADEDYYISHGGKIPVKWTAPEAIHYKKYSTASDVWAYGCLLYEIWSVGQAPFRDYSNTEALRKVTTGYRLSPPPGCPRLIYDIMIRCWNPDPSKRTPFKELIFELLQPEDTILRVPEADLNAHKLAGIIGGPLEGGEHMYQDLQTKYL